MPVLTRSKARSRHSLTAVASSRANPPGKASASTSEHPQQPSSEGGVNLRDRTFGGRPSMPLAAGNERSLAARTCRADCLSCPALIREKNFKSNITGRIYSAIDIKPEEVNCKLQNYIYLLTCTGCGIQYVGESIIPINKRMNIHRKGKSGCEISINHYE